MEEVNGGEGLGESTPGPAATHAHCGCTHIVRAEAIIINFPAKLNFNAFAAAEMKMKIASIGKIAKKSSGCCALECVYASLCVCTSAGNFIERRRFQQ